LSDLVVDVVIVGGGIDGASAGYELASTCSVAIVEREELAGYHSTGRSAALYTENYGIDTIRALTVASRPALEAPAAAFSAESFLEARGVLWLANRAQAHLLAPALTQAECFTASARIVGEHEIIDLCPLVRPGYAAGAVWEADAKDIDVSSLHQSYLRGFRRAGGRLLLDHEVTGLSREGGPWIVATSRGSIRCEVVVNAAGAWADDVAALAGIERLGLTPMRRTALTIDAPPDLRVAALPCVIDIEEAFYFKPDAGRVLISPADETPTPPTDAQAEDFDVAVAIDRFEQVASLKVKSVRSKWAGLRTFAPDRGPVIGFDSTAAGFFWLAGQGGYGIMTAPASSIAVRSLLTSGRLDEELVSYGLTSLALSPNRFR